MKRYNPKEIEPKWQQIWQETNLYTVDLNSSKPKYFAFGMFPYPSGNGIHVGHAQNFTIPDVKSRFKRQQGFESYHPVGWDSFGLPAENFAIKQGVSPQQSMATIIPGYRNQYRAMGWSNDWEKEITSSEPEYYKWTQWIFLKMHEHGLAYQDSRWQWWCTKCQTVLANEQVVDGKCWRHDGKDDPIVEKKEVKQWFFKITEYADELLDAVDDLDWTESVKLAQKNWIGKSKGAEVNFAVKDSSETITVFTTRPDTLYGVTFMVLAPDSSQVKSLTSPSRKAEVDSYVKATAKKTEVERQASKEKSGVFLGTYAINPVNGQEVPIYIADYVLSGYGTGAIMAVPAHDERDRAFAEKFDLPIKQVVAGRYVDIDNPHRVDKDLIVRNVVCMIVKNPDNDTYLINKPKGGASWAPMMGGIDEGEDIVVAARRELIEETGLVDIKSITSVGPVFASEFFAEHKDVNRVAYSNVVVVELNSLQTDLSLAVDKDDQDIKWVNEQEYRSQRVTGGMNEVLDIAQGKQLEEPKDGRLINSGEYDGLLIEEAKEKIIADLTSKKHAVQKTNYKMRDWSISRQRYWGAPIPVVNCPDCGSVVLKEADLPVILPELTDFKPSGDGRSALARAKDWLVTTCPECSGPAERETDTMDTYVDSAWYMMRYLDPHNQSQIFNSDVVNKWMSVDFYNGADHATAHLLYARFIARFFTKIGIMDNPEPFKQMLYNGKVVAKDGSPFSKTLGNGPDPLDIIAQGYGADALRTYLMFAAPLELGARWDPQGVPGAHRFLSRLWNITQEYLEAKDVSLTDEQTKQVLSIVHKATRKITKDLEENRYNTAIAASMEAVNKLYLLKTSIPFGKSDAWQVALEFMAMLIGPFAPHTADELWQQLGHSDSVNRDHWPVTDDQYLQDDTITLVVQVNGKLRAQIQIASDATKEDAIEAARSNEHVQTFIADLAVKKEIFVPGKLVNFVV